MEVISYAGTQLITSAGGGHYYSSAGRQLNNSTDMKKPHLLRYAAQQFRRWRLESTTAGGQLNNSTETEIEVISYAGMQLNFQSCKALQYRR
jgi:hypothetical protein